MREVNFSIPNANKASVGITTALYDRRALDCTSTLPLINSLNNLAYLTTSSARIRDILTVDGGVERLVCILKEGRRPKDMMECWKWNLAFQCVVNIGVRGSENVRTRVVEADMVPVIATILDNYIKVIDKCREKTDSEGRRRDRYGGSSSSSKHYQRSNDVLMSSVSGYSDRGARRQAPPPIEIPTPMRDPSTDASPLPHISLSSPPERTTFSRGHQHHRSTAESRTPSYHASHAHSHSHSRPITAHHQPLQTSIPSMDDRQETFGLRPVRDADRLPSMLPLPADTSSRPESPTTPNAPTNPPQQGIPLFRRAVGRRPSVRHQASMSQDSDEMADEAEEAALNDSGEEPIVGIESEMNLAMGDMDVDVDNPTLQIEGDSPVRIDPQPSTGDGAQEVDAFSMARSAIEGQHHHGNSNSNTTHTPHGQQGVLPAPNITAISPLPQLGTAIPPPHPMQLNPIARFAHERSASSNGLITSMPRDEDVLMCLQLLAYVSKYCNLRSYFQQSHLVPKLKISQREVGLFDAGVSLPLAAALPSNSAPQHEHEHDEDCEEDCDSMHTDDHDRDEPLEEEWQQADDFNIFPLVEKFTVRHHSQDMQYWAGVVMRNLCRKDDARGGIRQCAYYLCGKWEEYTRQFAKCRRCRRTKYCSKECQKAAWVYHRHWCVAATQ